MQSRTRTPVLLAVALAAAAALPAHAEGFYAGGSLGTTDWQADSIRGVPEDRSGAAGKLYGGWQFHPNFSLEAGAVTLGRFGPDARANGAFVDGVGKWTFADRWLALGRLGVSSMRMKALGETDRGTNLKVGLGVQYDLSQTTAVRGEWERYRLDTFGGKDDADMYSIGVQVAF
jgi:OOP family OmpA-OmpF porin